MKLLLKPISHPEIGDIVIENSLFAIGRREEPFESLAGGAAKLSRRHARIFKENGKAYIADLGSLNGTQIDGQQVDSNAHELVNGAVLCLGAEFNFTVDIEAELPERQGAQGPSLRLVLTPSSADMETLVVSQFPLLINRDDPMFSQFREQYPEDVRKVSRRHALFVLKSEQLHIEDLNSSNGTFINGERMDEHSRVLIQDDVVSFGSDRFSYVVNLAQTDALQDGDATVIDQGFDDVTEMLMDVGSETGGLEAQPAAPNLTASTESQTAVSAALAEDEGHAAAITTNTDRTRFIESATSFLDVFCGPEDDAVSSSDDAQQSQQPAEPKQSKTKQWRAALGLERVSRTGLLLGLLVLALIGGTAGTTYWLDSDKRQMNQLFDAGSYEQAVIVAERYLENNPDDYEAATLGEKALLRVMVPQWRALLERGAYADSEKLLQEAMQLGAGVGRARDMIGLLNWTGRVQQLVESRGSNNSAVSVLWDEKAVRSLVAEWDADQFKNQQLVEQMNNYAPSFVDIGNASMSHLRHLRNDDSTFGSAITRLKAEVASALKGDRAGVIEQLVKRFVSDYGTVAETQAYLVDLVRFKKLRSLAQDNQLVALAQTAERGSFATVEFAQFSESWLQQMLPDASLVQAFTEASGYWRDGQVKKAVATLEGLSDTNSLAEVQAKRDHYKRVDAAFSDLSTTPSAQQLLAFRSMLNLPEDERYKAATQELFQQQRDQILAKIGQSQAAASDLWQAYQQAGGIPGLMRIENRISDNFRAQAGRLTQAYEQIVEVSAQQSVVDVEKTAEWQALATSVTNEAKRQRMWLRELKLVLDEQMLAPKLALLPELKE